MMALALSLVGQPVQPYLTTGATDFVNSVQKGKEDAIKTEELKTQSQKSALDLLTAQKKQKDEQWYSDNAGALSRKVKTLDVADEDLAKMAQVNPEYHKVLQSERADAVKNFNASNLAYLGSSTDKAKSAQEIIQASEAHGMTIPDQFKQSPETLMQYLKVINAGSKAFDLKNVSKDESGDIITTDISNTVTDINPAAVKATKAKPVLDAKGMPVMVTLPNTNKRVIKMDDGTFGDGGTIPEPKTPTPAKQPRLQQVVDATGTYIVNLDTGETKPILINGKPVVKKPEAPSGEESSSAGYAFRMGEANKILTDFESNKKGLPTYAPSIASGVPVIGDYLENVTQNEDQQLYRNAALAWVRAKLRDESGATIHDIESSNEYKTYFPVMGDTEAKIKQKAKLREIAEAEMMLKAGKASTKLEETRKNYNAKNPPAKNAQGWTLHTDKYGNKAYVSPDGKQYQKVQ